MSFIKLTEQNGSRALINTNQIKAIYQARNLEDVRIIHFNENDYLSVLDTMDDIQALISKGES